MKRLTVDIKLHYSNSDQSADAEINTHDVPLTLVLESLNNLVKGIARQIVEEAAEVIPGSDQEKYFDSRLELDRKLLEDLISKQPLVNTEEPRYSFSHMIGFVRWYSGITEAKIIAAYTRYLKEKQP